MEKWSRIYINNNKTNYEISNKGRCRNIKKLHWKTSGILKPKRNNKSGYVQYCIVHSGKNHYMYGHRLVATSFIREIPEGLEINHIDGVKHHNHVSNLEIVTRKENMRHCFDHNLCSTVKPIKQFSLRGDFLAVYQSISEASRATSINIKNISACANGLTLMAGGYQWDFDLEKLSIDCVVDEYKRHGDGVVQLTMSGEYIQTFNKIADAYEYLGAIDNGIISQVCKGRRGSHRKFKWTYKSDYYKETNKNK